MTLSNNDVPNAGEIWEHTKTGNAYTIVGTVFNTVTDQVDVLYSPLYDCEHPMFSQQLRGAAKAWTLPNDDGTPRFFMLRDLRGGQSFQDRVGNWLIACFGPTISADRIERCDRFIEEALELTQAVGYGAERAHALVDYVFGRPVGEPFQETGGVLVTLAALCMTCGLDMQDAGENELARVWTKIDQIRAKQAAKPTGSALPGLFSYTPNGGADD